MIIAQKRQCNGDDCDASFVLLHIIIYFEFFFRLTVSLLLSPVTMMLPRFGTSPFSGTMALVRWWRLVQKGSVRGTKRREDVGDVRRWKKLDVANGHTQTNVAVAVRVHVQHLLGLGLFLDESTEMTAPVPNVFAVHLNVSDLILPPFCMHTRSVAASY